MVKAIFNGEVVAQSNNTEVVEGNHYFPPEDINIFSFVKSDKTTTCAWKGTANYYDLMAGGETAKDAAWYYQQPKPEAKNIEGYVAFGPAVEVVED